MYTKYLWTHQNDDNIKLGAERLHLDAVNSHRWRTGTRLTHDVELKSGIVTSPYIGAAFDYEFGGKQKASYKGFGNKWDIDEPTLRGGTGMGEIGLTLKPSAASPVSFDFAVQGYTGKREGIAGNLNLRYDF